MEESVKTIRLSKLAREIDLGISTLVEFYRTKGYEIDSNPNTILKHELYQVALNHFDPDRKITKSYTSNKKTENSSATRVVGKIDLDLMKRKAKKQNNDESESDIIPTHFSKILEPTVVGKINLPEKRRKPAKLKSLDELSSYQQSSNEKTKKSESNWTLGKVKFFDETKGFGFISCINEPLDCFVHISKIESSSISDNEYVIFKKYPSRKKTGDFDAQKVFVISDFTLDWTFVEEQFINSLGKPWNKKLLDILPEESMMNIVGLKLDEFNPNSQYEDVSTFLDSLKLLIGKMAGKITESDFKKMIGEWAENIDNNFLKIQLWELNFSEELKIETAKKVFKDLKEETREKIFSGLSCKDQFSLIAQNEEFLDIEIYYRYIFSTIKNFIEENDFLTLDLEFNGHAINEFAFSRKGALRSGTEPNIDEILSEFAELQSSTECYLVGHNIEEFDIPIIKDHIELSSQTKILDTLMLEIILSPTMKSFALDTKHTAAEDVLHTKNLFLNQIIRLIHLPTEKLKSISHFIEPSFLKIIHDIRKSLKKSPAEYYPYFENERNKYFINKNFSKGKINEFSVFLDDLNNEPAIIISTEDFFPVLAEIPQIQIFDHDSDYSRIISNTKVESLDQTSLEKYLLRSYIELCEKENKSPILANLPGRIKNLITRSISIEHIADLPETATLTSGHICFTPNVLYNKVSLLKELNRRIIFIEKDLISVTFKLLLKTLDYTIFRERLNHDAFWLYFTGGQSRVEISRSELYNLNITDIEEAFEYFWVEKTSFDTFQVWGTFDYKKFIENKLEGNQVLQFSFTKEKLKKENCLYVVPGSTNKLSITRYNPETRYRERYWTFQTFVVKQIIEETNRPTVLIINQPEEKQKLYDYFVSNNFYVPDQRANLHRQLKLLLEYQSFKKLIIITKSQVQNILHSDELNNFNFILDSFELEEKWFISKGTGFLEEIEKKDVGLKFKHDDDYKVSDIETIELNDFNEDKEDKSDLISSSNDIFLLLSIQKPIIDYYRWLFNSIDRNSTVWLTDSRLSDFEGLEEEWGASKKFFQLWKNTEEYDEDYLTIKQFFSSPIPKEEIQIDAAGAKEALREIFLKDGDLVHPWHDYQEDFLDEILPAKKDILVTLPTGGGKSILFQAPALYRGSISGRLTIVITPLKALMEDHVHKLWELKFWASVDFINSDRRDIQYIYRRIAGGEILLLYITPERFRSKSFVNALKMRLENDGGLEYAVYDEAHCVSQWGLDFRPDYLNSANINKSLKENAHSKFPLLLFSATVSEQIFSDFQLRFDNSIERIENYSKAYNPLREHISIYFEACSDPSEKIQKIAESLFNSNFNPKLSRCIIFVRTRKDAENNVTELEKYCNEYFGRNKYTGRISYFHAGLNAEERSETYSAYKSGEIYILLATKAFGMGMDIPNIHFLYHHGPSGAIEDYLQEVGRAGRNKLQLNAAGFSNDKPIQAKCFLDKKNDFKRIKDLLQDGRITWTNLISVFNTLIEYYDRFMDFDSQDDNPIILPFNVLSQSSLFDDVFNKDQLLRLSLYWLEKLNRINLGFYAPSQLEFTDFEIPNEKLIESKKQKALIEVINVAWATKPKSASSVAIELNQLLRTIGDYDASELLKIIFLCQKNNILKFNNDVTIYPTKKKKDELMYYATAFFDESYPMLEAVFSMTKNLMNLTTEKEQFQYENEVLEDFIKEISGEYFNKNTLPWMIISNNGKESVDKDRIKKEQKEFETSKIKFAFTIADFIPKVRYKSIIKHQVGQKPQVVQLIYNGCKEKEEWKGFLKEFKNDLISLLKFTIKYFIKGDKRHNVSDVIIKLKLDQKDLGYIEDLFSIAKWLGYIHYEGSILPMGVELFLVSKKEIEKENPNSKDKSIYEEFQKTQKLRELRLIALECLSEINTVGNKNEFITRYFNCNNTDEIITLIIDYFGEDSEMINSFREIALDQAVYGEKDDAGARKGGLSEEQLKVYEADLYTNIQVMAGPGSGKTHTLILRVARLIHQENIKPENILVLAYNRAVVIELKERLSKLFTALGYGNLVKRLKVFTFSGFCKFCLRENLQDIPVKDWEKEFVKRYDEQPGLINIYLGNIKFVFVDEFQDITSDRLKLLKQIANIDYAKITVIGDPNQSIYGFERVDDGGSRSPKIYYEKFDKHYQPTNLRINDNFRSYPKILRAAEKIICYNQDTFDFEPLRPRHKADHHYLNIIESNGIDDSWINELSTLLNERNPNTDAKYRQIALMFRRNVEIYRAYNLIEKKKRSENWNLRIRIQGENEDYTRTREIAWLLDNFYKPKSNDKLSNQLILEFKKYIKELSERFPLWDEYYFILFECLLIEFLKNIDPDLTYNDLIEYVEDLARKDDGQLSKIYYFNHHSVAGQEQATEIVLTTMHKVKGLEFDAVIIPASFTNLPFVFSEDIDQNSEEFRELIEEERRLTYVAYTRAKFRLITYYGEREKALIQGNQFSLSEELINDLGISVKPGINKYFISWGATDSGNVVFSEIENSLKFGAELSLKKATNNWFLFWKNLKIGCISGPISRKITDQTNGSIEIKGFRVTNVFKWTFLETQEYDLKNSTDFEKHWTPQARERGYIYLIEFSGYGEPL